MKKHGQVRFDVTAKAVCGNDPRHCLPAAQMRDLNDRESITRYLAELEMLRAINRERKRIRLAIIITAAALISGACLAGYIISKL